MKKSELRQLIKEEISKVLKESMSNEDYEKIVELYEQHKEEIEDTLREASYHGYWKLEILPQYDNQINGYNIRATAVNPAGNNIVLDDLDVERAISKIEELPFVSKAGVSSTYIKEMSTVIVIGFEDETMKKSELQRIIREEISKVMNENVDADYTANYIAGDNFSKYIVPNSPEYTYGPDDDGTYYIEFQLAFDTLDYNTPEEEEEELQDAMGGNEYGGPGARFSNTTVSYEGQENGKYVFTVSQRGGYDI